MKTDNAPTSAPVERLVRLRFVADGPLDDDEHRIAEHIRPMLAERGFDADDFDISAAFACWCEDAWCASWLDEFFFQVKHVDALLKFLVPAI